MVCGSGVYFVLSYPPRYDSFIQITRALFLTISQKVKLAEAVFILYSVTLPATTVLYR
jgi:hypothetical protein